MRKIIGILNIVAGVSILSLLVWLVAHGNYSVSFREPLDVIYTIMIFTAAGTSLAGGILVLKGRGTILDILAAVNLIFAGYVLFLQVLGVSFALFE